MADSPFLSNAAAGDACDGSAAGVGLAPDGVFGTSVMAKWCPDPFPKLKVVSPYMEAVAPTVRHMGASESLETSLTGMRWPGSLPTAGRTTCGQKGPEIRIFPGTCTGWLLHLAYHGDLRSVHQDHVIPGSQTSGRQNPLCGRLIAIWDY